MQLTQQFSGRVSRVAFGCALVAAVGTTTSLSGRLVRTGLPVAPGVAQDPAGAFPSNVPTASFAALWPQMAYQRTDSSCTVATVTVAVNALRAARGLAPVTQEAVVASDPSGHWWHATQADGPGLDLDAAHLAALGAAASLGDAPRDRNVGVQAVHVPPVGAPLSARAEARRALAYALDRMVKTPSRVFVLVNFNQGRLVRRGANEGHFSLVGAWDEARERVLVLDVGREQMRPYWVPLDGLVDAMQLPDDATGEPRGYLVVVRDA